MPLPTISLYLDNVSDIQNAIEMCGKASYDRIVLRIINPLMNQRSGKNQRSIFTRSDLLLSAEQWRFHTILKVGETGDLNSSNTNVQRQSQRNLKEEIEWAKHLDSIAHVLVTLNNDESVNLARQLLDSFDLSGMVLAETSIIDKSFFRQQFGQHTEHIEKSAASTLTWKQWNNFRLTTAFKRNFKVALELSSILPSECDIRRWYGEPVHMIIIPSFLFERTDENNQICLKEEYVAVCMEFMNRTKASFVVRCTHDDPLIASYPKCLQDTFSNANRYNARNHECNKLDYSGMKFPLTPTDTVNNCVKYLHKMHCVYARAVQLAIEDRMQSNDKVRLMICGWNGWKFLEPVITVIGNSDAVEMFILDEDPCNRISITEAIKHLYTDRSSNITILADTKNKQYFQQMDIVVSLTSEAIFESQWLQFNFNRAHDYIRPNAIFIPRQTSLTIMPITSAMACAYMHDGQNVKYRCRQSVNGMENYVKRAQTMTSLYTRNVYECAVGQQLFPFQYTYENSVQISTDTQMKRLQFTIVRDCIVTGLGGYHQLNLYKDITLNNHAILNAHNEDCIPMVYFPLKNPQTISTRLNVTIWQHTDAAQHRHWYEWQTTSPLVSFLHNLRGEAYTLQQYH